jgi:hypothetical protein
MSWRRRPTRSMVSMPTIAPTAAKLFAAMVLARSSASPSAVNTCGAKVKIAKYGTTLQDQNTHTKIVRRRSSGENNRRQPPLRRSACGSSAPYSSAWK